MKTKIILLALLSCVFNTAFAQIEKVATIEGDLNYIHPASTLDGKCILYNIIWNGDNTQFKFFDSDFNVTKTINVNGHLDHSRFYNFDNGEFIDNDYYYNYLTQSVFNDDELFEYVTREYDPNNHNLEKYKIINENEVVLAEINPEGSEDSFWWKYTFKLNGETYILIGIDNDQDQYQIWKIDKKNTAVNKVADYKAEAGKSFDIAGRRMNRTASHNSIIIEDGVKHIK